MTRVLVLNSGSSSLKLQIVDTELPDDRSALATALVERIGSPGGHLEVRRTEAAGSPDHRESDTHFDDHTSAFEAVLAAATELEVGPEILGVEAVGHRVVHGGLEFTAPVEVSPAVEQRIEELCLLAPLHNPANLRGIRVARDLLPELPHVAVFDTGFFHTLPPHAYTYAIDHELAEKWTLRRFGFHGTSHDYVSHRVAALLDRPYDSFSQLVLHLGNGASISAVTGGEAVDTSMGLTPLEGLVMGTRGGDVDPGLLIHLIRDRGMEPAEVSTLLNRNSGLQGLTGQSDFRELTQNAAAGDEAAQLAYQVVLHRLRGYIGSYWARMGSVDAITFTGGVGENAADLRAEALATLGGWGVEVDDEANRAREHGPRIISTPSSAVTVAVVPTNEELAIARACDDVLGRSR